MKKMKLLLSGLIALSIFSLASCNKKAPSNIAILYTNDVHCAFEENEESMGIEGIAGIKELLQNEYGKDYVTLVDSGDFIQGEAIGTISNGLYPKQIQEYLGYEYATFGNHEFDYGMDNLLGIGGLVFNGNTKYVSGNFVLENLNEQVVNPYEIKDYGNFKVAFVGVSTPATLTTSNPSYFQDEYGNWVYGFCSGNDGEDLYTKIQDHVTNARANGADYVVALSHLGTDEELKGYRSSDLIANTTGIDVILDGHSHSTIEKDIIKNKNGEDVILSSTGSKLQNIGKLVINTNGTKSKKDDNLEVDLLSVNEVKVLTNGLNSINDAKAYYEEIKNQYEDQLSVVVANSEVDLKIYNENGTRTVRNSENVLGSLCADAFRNIMDADVALINGGGVRANILKGDITYEDIISVQPYGNYLCLIEASGQEILDVLEVGASAIKVEVEELNDGTYNAVGESGKFQHVSGLKYTIDPFIPSGVVLDENEMFVKIEGLRRVKDVFVFQDGEFVPLDVNKTYKLASHNYLIKSGGDGLNMFMDNKLLLDETILDNQALIKYIQENLSGKVTKDYIDSLKGRIKIVGR